MGQTVDGECLYAPCSSKSVEGDTGEKEGRSGWLPQRGFGEYKPIRKRLWGKRGYTEDRTVRIVPNP